ncbi:hypothetical protein R1flu_005708 [Riccia fluitans]|uniref:Uncharacterized protein n=1 Tax=Riccia fluitans TaxID=41844 RepID=A0ABD1YUV4_9MARC
MGRPPHDDQPESSMRWSSRVKSAFEKYGVWFPSDQVDEHDNVRNVYALITEEGEPSSYEEAQNLVEKAEWNTKMQKEMNSLNDDKTWELVELPQGQASNCLQIDVQKEGRIPSRRKDFQGQASGQGIQTTEGCGLK